MSAQKGISTKMSDTYEEDKLERARIEREKKKNEAALLARRKKKEDAEALAKAEAEARANAAQSVSNAAYAPPSRVPDVIEADIEPVLEAPGEGQFIDFT